MSSQPRAACHLLSRLMPRLARAEPSCKTHRLCHRSFTLLATCSSGSYHALPALSRLLALLRVSCKPCAACRLLFRLRPRLACAELSSTVYCACHGSLALLATCSLGSCRASPAPSHLLTFIACDMPARAASHLLFRLTPRLVCAEPSSKSYRRCRRSITLLVTCSFGSYSAKHARPTSRLR